MTNREQLIRERAYSLWETEGSPDGKHEDHWQQAEREIDGGNSGLAASDAPNPPEMDLEPVSLPDLAGTDEQDAPPARAGKAEKESKPIEGAGSDNPVHHTGEQPLSPLSK